MSILDLFEREHGIDHWLNSSTRQQRHNFSGECRGDCDLLLQRSRAEHRTNDMETFAEYLIQVDISLTAGDSADKDDPSSQRCGFEAGGEIRTTIQIEDNVKSAAGSHAFGKSRKPR